MKPKIHNTALVGDRVRHPRFSAVAKVLQERPDGLLLVEFDHGKNSDGVEIKTLGEYPASEFSLDTTPSQDPLPSSIDDRSLAIGC